MLSLFQKACRKLPAERPPVWFMRQAGRYMAEYREIRRSNTLLEICKNPQLAAEVTAQPIEALGVDAAIIFADLLLPLETMGLKVEFLAGEGPSISEPVRSPEAIEALATHNTPDLGYVGEAIRIARTELNPTPVIGFVGAPFTLASYMVEGGGSRHFANTKRLMYSDPDSWDRLAKKLVEVVVPFGASQIAAGAEAIQVFDSWAGALSPDDYERYALPYAKMVVERLQTTESPVIYFGTGASSYLSLLNKTRPDVLGLDWRVRLDEAWESIDHGPAVQGNLDPLALLAPLPELKARVTDILDRAGGRDGHVFNLGHGIVPETPVENVRAVVEMVKEHAAVAQGHGG